MGAGGVVLLGVPVGAVSMGPGAVTLGVGPVGSVVGDVDAVGVGGVVGVGPGCVLVGAPVSLGVPVGATDVGCPVGGVVLDVSVGDVETSLMSASESGFDSSTQLLARSIEGSANAPSVILVPAASRLMAS